MGTVLQQHTIEISKSHKIRPLIKDVLNVCVYNMPKMARAILSEIPVVKSALKTGFVVLNCVVLLTEKGVPLA